jgi:putative DNA primase/helicase
MLGQSPLAAPQSPLLLRRWPDIRYLHVPRTLTELPRWGLYDPKKIPHSADPDGGPISSIDLDSWRPFEVAKQALGTGPSWLEPRLCGLGFVFAPDDHLVGIDLDHVLASSTLLPWAAELLATVVTYTEVSISGTGLHLFARGELPAGCRHKRGMGGGSAVEAYDRGRFFTVTGHPWPGTPEDVRPIDVSAFLAKWLPARPAIPITPRRARPVSLADYEIIQRARAARNGDRFMRLWHGRTDEFGGDESRADLALMAALAFWTGSDPARMEQLFSQSALAQRAKWTHRPDYRDRTIRAACERQNDAYAPTEGRSPFRH